MPKFTKKIQDLWPTLLIGVGLVLLIVSGIHSTWQDRSLRLRAEQLENTQTTLEQRNAFPSQIFIPWRVDTTINPGELQNGKWSIDQNSATYLTQSARPGEGGNVVLYGHNTREILGNIRVLEPGEKITITSHDGARHEYEVEWSKEVSPEDVSAIQPTETEVLTLFTCSGFLDSQRFIVRARPVSKIE